MAWFETGHEPGITFKVSDIGWEVLRDAPGCRPAPYMASRGLKWIQSYAKPGLSKGELKGYLRASYAMVAQALPRRVRSALEARLAPGAWREAGPRGAASPGFSIERRGFPSESDRGGGRGQARR